MKPLSCTTSSRTLASLLLAVLSSLSSHGESSSWTGWLGPDRAAQAQGFEAPQTWPDKLTEHWRVEVGEGYATPLVIGNRIFQHARQGDDEVVWCLDRTSGKAIWRKQMPVEFVPGRNGESHGLGPKSTPTYADGRVFTLSIIGVLTAWSAEDGKRLWTRDFREYFDVSHPYWGTATSPLVEGDRLFAHTGSCENGALFCLDPETGKDLWVRKEEANCYSSPRLETFEGVRQLVSFNHDGLCGYDLEDGSLLWKHSYPHLGNNQNTPTPARFKNVLVVGGESRQVFGLRISKSADGWNAERIWRHREAGLEMSSPVVQGSLLYGFSPLKTGQFFCLDPLTGAMKWKGTPRMGENAQLLSIPGYILTLTDDGTCRILQATGDKENVVHHYQVSKGETWAAPALLHDRLLIKEKNHLTSWGFAE
ncbi:PQQ-binding-like beta-propeller repeat protein [Haloferula chungangensis]|uniref:PQQ-binding-like beta-propeller repeat protein n=1 Tax=Haloferula chungangensis TaxID=1048331 RepID=A0ABW2L8F1_9BACT